MDADLGLVLLGVPQHRAIRDRPQRSCGSRCTARVSGARPRPGGAAAHRSGRRARRAGQGRPGRRSPQSPCGCRPPSAPRCWNRPARRPPAAGRRRTCRLAAHAALFVQQRKPFWHYTLLCPESCWLSARHVPTASPRSGQPFGVILSGPIPDLPRSGQHSEESLRLAARDSSLVARCSGVSRSAPSE